MVTEEQIVLMQQEIRAKAEQGQHHDGPQKEGFQRAGQVQRAQIEIDGDIAHIGGHSLFELPGPCGEPVDQHGDNADGQQ